ncbi:MAG TPA: hypothetical protein VMG63_25510 [Terriglobia bacterium]|nr:hypothetical protein [Terriglobia bacterium]
MTWRTSCALRARLTSIKIELMILPTAEAIKALEENADQTNAILHVTC